jgi:hypothetical protein
MSPAADARYGRAVRDGFGLGFGLVEGDRDALGADGDARGDAPASSGCGAVGRMRSVSSGQ